MEKQCKRWTRYFIMKGLGVINYSNDEKYEGSWKDGKKDGKGKVKE